MTTNVGILGIGMYLPPEVRRNDWWPESVVASWMEQRKAARSGPPRPPRTEGEALVMKAMSEQAIDPFQGAVERHVMPAGMSIVDMEEQAARMAIERAGIDPGSIDLVLTHTAMPDELLGNPACAVHHRLGLPKACLTLQADASTYSFLSQLTLARAMIVAGSANHALLIQSCGASRLVDIASPIAPLFGDGATAIVLGPVSNSRGIRSAAHITDGRFPRTLVASVPHACWFDAGRAVLHVGDADQMQEVFLSTADACREGIETALRAANVRSDEIDVFCIHQGTPWLRRVVQTYTGLDGARSVETFAKTGYMFAAILPAGLYVAEREGALATDDLVILTGGGPGMTYGALVLRWGR